MFCAQVLVCHFRYGEKLIIPPAMADRQDSLKALATCSSLNLSCLFLTRAFNADLTTL